MSRFSLKYKYIRGKACGLDYELHIPHKNTNWYMKIRAYLKDENGISITVEVIDEKYTVKRIDKDISYKHINATMNGIATAFNMLLNESNKQYE